MVRYSRNVRAITVIFKDVDVFNAAAVTHCHFCDKRSPDFLQIFGVEIEVLSNLMVSGVTSRLTPIVL